MQTPYKFKLSFNVITNDIEAIIDMPKNFISEDPKHQVTILHGLREQFQSMDLGELKLTSSYDTELNKSLLISEYAGLFPMESKIIVDFDSTENSHFIKLKHDKKMSRIPTVMQPIFVALVISSLTAAGTLIVAANEGMIK
jgi:hypothetical protein